MALLDSKQLNPRLTGSFTLSGSLSTEKNTRIVSNLTEIIKVTVVSDNGNKYAFEGATAPSITVAEGKTYRFDTSDSTNSTHPFRFSTTLSGSWGGGSAYTTGVTVNGTAGQSGSTVVFAVPSTAPSSLIYYCTQHGNSMGNVITIEESFAEIDVVGTVNKHQSGLTAGQTYYVQTDGTLGLTADDPSVVAGTAISATELIVKG